MSVINQPTTEEQPELYDRAQDMGIGPYLPRNGLDFVEAVLDETAPELFVRDYRVAEIYGYGEDEELELLLVYPDETRQFVGEDETAKRDSRLFSFAVRPSDSLPAVRTVEEALDLLKPPGVDRALIDGEAGRQGEWWLLPDCGEPAGSVFKPGVAERPFGGSPLGNHVPREYGFGVPDDVFVERFVEHTPELEPWIDSVEDAVWHVTKAGELEELDGFELITDVPSPADLRDMADGVYVQGTLRHRNSEHYVEKIGEDWHLAKTHDMDVWTADSFDLRSSNSGWRARID